jgi:hypothetical protein
VNKNGLCAMILINPTDCRGYRLIVNLWNKDDPKLTLNRPWSIEEMDVVMFAGAMLMQFMASIGCYPQLYFAGNNCVEAVSDGSCNYIAGIKEPAMLHFHVLGRGIDGVEYIDSIPLIQPGLGEEVNLKGQGSIENGMQKIPWNADIDAMCTYRHTLDKFLKKHFSAHYESAVADI